MRISEILISMMVVALGGSVAWADGPAVDGRFEEWNAATLLASDPSGDATDVFDVTAVHAASCGSELFLSFDITSVLNLQAGPPDEESLRVELGFPGGQQLTIDFRDRVAYTGGAPGNYVPWSTLDYVSLSTYAGQRFELRVDVSALGFGFDDSLAIDFSGSDTLAAPVGFQLETPAPPPVMRSAQRAPCTTFRIASLNTLFGGLLDPDRAEPIGRLVQAPAADIYCFQEQNSDISDIADRLQELDPLGNGSAWNVQRSGDTVIASQYPLIEVPHPGDAAAVVDLGSSGAVVVFSIHPPCCGYIGSGQDQARVAEMMDVVMTLDDLRNAALGSALVPYRYAPVIIVGDWNLVGSRTPLDLVEDPQGADQSQRLLPHLVGNNVYTWRDLTESPGSFSPGLLDLLTYSTDLLLPQNGFVLDSSALDAGQLSELGLESADSLASDHLLLVGDFTTFAGGDLTGDGVVGAFDLAGVLGSWGVCPLCPADLNSDGQVDAADLGLLLGSWGACPG